MRTPTRPGRRVTPLITAVLFGATLIAAPAASAAGPTLDGTIRAGDPGPVRSAASPPSVEDEILVRYAPGTTARERAAVRKANGLSHVRTSANGRTDVVTAPGQATATVRRHLAAEPEVIAVAPNHQRELAVDPTTEPGFGVLWGLHNTGQLVDGTPGKADADIDGLQALGLGIGRASVVVAVVDDGVDFSHPDLAARAWTNPGEAGPLANNGIDDDGNGYVDDVHGWDFCNDDATVHDAMQDGHGTHVAGTIAASLDGAGIVGVAPGVSIMAVKFIDNGRYCGTDDQAVAAIDYAASFGVPIINASWGGPGASSVLDAAIAESHALLVAAAGNDGTNMDALGATKFYPAASTLPNVMSVAAIDQSGARASFSDYGPISVDIAAPGSNILSTWPAEVGCPSPCYAWLGGTSMAAPHVAGTAALVVSDAPSLGTDPLGLKNRLLGTGQGISGGTGWMVSGRIVNAFHARDPVPPVVAAANRWTVPTGSVVTAGSSPIRVAWPPAHDARTWIAGYGAKRHGPTGWATLATRTKATSVATRMSYGASYRFRVTAQDGPGNVGGPVDSPTVVARLHSDSSGLATYGRGWRTIASSSALGGKAHATSTRGASMSFSFTGRSVAIIAPKSPTRGSIKVYVDGVLQPTVSLYRSRGLSKIAVFSASWTTSRSHRLKVVVASAKRVDIDGFVVVR